MKVVLCAVFLIIQGFCLVENGHKRKHLQTNSCVEHMDDHSPFGPHIGDKDNICWKTVTRYVCPAVEEGNVLGYDCPLLEKGSELIAICTDFDKNSTKYLYLPENITGLCLRNSSIIDLFEGSFRNFPNLTFLDLKNSRKLENINGNAFVGLSNLTSLSMGGHSLHMNQVTNHVLQPLVRLKVLNISHWNVADAKAEEHLKFRFFQYMSDSVEILDMTEVNKESITGRFWELKKPLFANMSSKKLKCLSLSHNQIITIREGIVDQFPYIEQLWLSSNMLMGGDSRIPQEFANMTSLLFIDMEYQNYVRLPYYYHKKVHHNCENSENYQSALYDYEEYHDEMPKYGVETNENIRSTWSSDDNSTCMKMPPNLQKLNIGYVRLASIYTKPRICNYVENSQLSVINAQLFFINYYLSYAISNFPNLIHLNLCSSRIAVNSSLLFVKLKKLEYLNLQSFKLYLIFPPHSNESAWKKLTETMNFQKLEYLNLAYNRLCYIYPKFLENMYALKKLILKGNRFTSVPFNITKLENLTHLDLSYNRIVNMNGNFTNDMFKSAKRSGQKGENLTIVLTGNDMLCSCADRDTIIKIRNNRKLKFIGFNCTFISRENIDIYHIDIKGMNKRCGYEWKAYQIQCIFSFFGIVLLLIAIPNFLYRFRHSLSFCLYSVKYLFKNHCSGIRKSKEFAYDAFLCCHTDDIAKLRELYSVLEKQHGYRLFIIERDGLAGRTMLDGIKEAFILSHHTIFVISNKMLKSSLLKYTLHLIRERHDKRRGGVIFVLLDKSCKMPQKKLPNVLEYLLCTSLCLTWETNSKVDSVFWMQLLKALGPA